MVCEIIRIEAFLPAQYPIFLGTKIPEYIKWFTEHY
jgi:hypothetical protein